jgi:predicted CXXCH cytochrome family protein
MRDTGALALTALLGASVSLGVLVAHDQRRPVSATSVAQPAVALVPQPPAGRSAEAVWWLDPADARTYVGSPACERCHQEAYRQWNDAFHLQMTREVAESRVLGDFSRGTRFEQHGRRYSMEVHDGRFFLSVAHGARPPERFEVHYTLGARRAQGYLSKLPDGRIYVLPAFWHREQQRWFDWKEITPVPDTEEDLRQIWNVTCFNCHATNLAKNFDLASKTYATTWTEMGVACEACHGPGKAHIDLMVAWERDPASTPVYDRRRSNHLLSRTLKIFAARTADRRQVFDACAYCHGNKNNLFTGFVPGARYEDYALPFLVSQPVPQDDPQGDFWADGRPSRFNRPQALMQSGCFRRGDATCVSCHVAHGSKNESALKVPIAQSDALCTQCHEASPGHTFHRADSPGSRCVNCHMSTVNWRLLMRRRDHTFRPPVPELTSRLGVPNACNECHDDKPPEWAAAQMDRWYGEGDQARRVREVARAEAFNSAAIGDPAALPALASILVDRRWDPVTRASAGEFLTQGVLRVNGDTPAGTGRQFQSQTSFENASGAASLAAAGRTGPQQVPTGSASPAGVIPSLVNALIGGAADPEAMVRAHAVRALGFTGERRALTALSSRLVDPARAVRIAAAEALLHLGFAQLPGPAGAALTRAQDEYAQSLSSFGDMAGDHLALGWLQMERGLTADARTALSNALHLRPDQLQARIYLGVLAAREGHYGEAIREWERVRAKAPSWPNIDRLIEEARKRRSGPRP